MKKRSIILGFVAALYVSAPQGLDAQERNFTMPSFSAPDFSKGGTPVIKVPEIAVPEGFNWNQVDPSNFFRDDRFGSMAGLEELVTIQALVARFDFESELEELLKAVRSGEMPAEEFVDRLGTLFALYGDIAMAAEASGAGSTCQHSACEITGDWLVDAVDPAKVAAFLKGLDCTRAICTEELNPVILLPAGQLASLLDRNCTDTKCIPEEFEDTWVGIDYKFLKKLTECNDAKCEEGQEGNPVLDEGDDTPPEDPPAQPEEEDEEAEEVVAGVDHSQTTTILRYESPEDMAKGVASEVTVVETSPSGATTSTHYRADYSSGAFQLGEQLSGAYYTGRGVEEPSSHSEHVKLFSYPEGLFLVQ